MSAAINGLNNTPPTPPSSSDRIGNNKLGKEEFLKLLMAQMANQDPTKPQDNGQFIAQLAQFASLEQAQATNGRLDTLLLAQANATHTNYVNFIGKDVEYSTESIHLQSGLTAVSSATLDARAEKVTVKIVDANGRTVRTMELGAHQAGKMQITWDGKDDGGTPQPAGAYSVKATATDASGASVGVELKSTGHVTGVEFEKGIPKLNINGTLINMSEVTSIKERNQS